MCDWTENNSPISDDDIPLISVLINVFLLGLKIFDIERNYVRNTICQLENWYTMLFLSFGSNMREYLLLEYASGLFAHHR